MNKLFLINFFKNIFFSPRKFFFENLGVRQTIFKNTFWLTLAEAITRFLKLFLLIYVARILGATEYGKFTFAMAFASLFTIFADFGLCSITVREFSRYTKKEKEFSSLLSLKILLGLGTIILIILGSFFITSDPLIQKLIWIFAFFVIVESFGEIVFAFFHARQKMEYQAWTKIFEALLVTGAGFYVLFYLPSVFNLSLAYLFSALVAVTFILIFFSFKIFPLKLAFNKSLWKNYLKLSWPLALTGLFAIIYMNTDSVMMGYFGQITETGWYNAARRIIGVSLIPASLIAISFYPVLSRFLVEKEKLQRSWNYYLEAMIFLAMPILVGGMASAQKIIDFVYDPSFFPAILAFQILLAMAAIQMISMPFGQILVVFNQQKKIFWITLSGAILNIILNLILIPRYSLYGAAFTTFITVSLVLFLLFQHTQKLTTISSLNLKLFSSFLGVAISSLAMYFVIIQPQIFQLHILPAILIGAGVYLICFLGYKVIFDKIF